MLKIFEIKLYGLSPEKFEEKIDNKRREFYSICKAQNRTKEESMLLYSHYYANKNTYENYSIGYLQILYNGFSLCYEAKIMLSERHSSQKEIQELLANLELDDTLTEEKKNKKKTAILNSHALVPYKPRLFTEKKRYMSKYHIEGVYTRISRLTNFEIAQAIREDICLIQKNDLLKSVYFDLSYFNDIIEHIDFISLFEKHKLNKTSN